jgi:SAM-dependent methyltransferase
VPGGDQDLARDCGLLAELWLRERRPTPNVSFVAGDVTHLPPDLLEFDLVGSLRTLHHVRRTELAFAELARVTRPGGLVLVVDQVAPADRLVALELDRFERARDPTQQRTLADADFRHFFELNELRCMHTDFVLETHDLERYLDLAACEGVEHEGARALAPGALVPGYRRLVPVTALITGAV